ncbi:perlucin-like isoform X1 [Apostichopus japonicus]|uniref:perlucin-like isoform X1 n=1 Tax=Stichopus japonicus TaxID=307972 RepID=UPI003AB194BA
MKRTCYLPLIVILVIPADASICYSHHRTSDRSSIFRQTSCHGDHDLEVPPDSSIVTSLLNFIPDRHYQDVNERTVGTPCDGATEHRLLNMTQDNSTTKERVNHQSMYWISNYTSTWSDAVDRCRQLFNNGHLVHIDNEEENNEVNAIRYQANISNANIWIGIHDSEKEGEWIYEDGSPLTYHNWEEGQPNDLRGQDCAVTKNNGLYSDIKCTKSHYFCCEYYL